MSVMTIYKPEFVEEGEGVRLQSMFEIDGIKDVLWYEVNKKYRDFLTFERADAFVVGLLYLALQEGVDIKVNFPMSERLNYSLNKYLIPLLADVFKYNEINIYCDYLTSESLESSNGVGTGLSCGIDSFSTILDHTKKDFPEEYEITHFTYFNVGSHGEDGDPKVKELFKKRLKPVETCANELNKDLIIVDSNLNEILMTGFAKIHTIRSMSVVLALQKLFKVYYYSSSVPVKKFNINKHHMGSYDIFILNMLSTESTTLFSSCSTLTRVEKTDMISRHSIVKRYLNVCASDNLNCGKCSKCLRTLLTLEILGELENYSAIFNLSEYYKARSNYLTYIVAHHDESVFLEEIYEEIMRINFHIPFNSRLIGKLKALKKKTKRIVAM